MGGGVGVLALTMGLIPLVLALAQPLFALVQGAPSAGDSGFVRGATSVVLLIALS